MRLVSWYFCFCLSIFFLLGTGRVAGWWQARWRATVNLCQQAGPDDSHVSFWTSGEPQFAHNQGPHVAGPGLLSDVRRRSAGKMHIDDQQTVAYMQCTILFLGLIWSFKRLHWHLLFIRSSRLVLRVKHILIFLKSKEALLLCHFHMFWVTVKRLFCHCCWVNAFIVHGTGSMTNFSQKIRSWCSFAAHKQLYLLYKCMKSNLSLEIMSPFFAGWHDLGVQKYKISKEMTCKEKDGPGTAATVQAQSDPRSQTTYELMTLWHPMCINVLLCIYYVVVVGTFFFTIVRCGMYTMLAY